MQAASEAAAPAEAVPPATAKAKRPARERKKKERFALLHSMTVEQRRQYLLEQDAQAVAKAESMRRAVTAGDTQRIAVDLSFDAIMSEKEIHSLAKQLKLSYGAVKGMAQPFQLHFFNCSDALRQSLARFSADKWLVRWHDDFGVAESTDVTQDVVYLSPDSPNVLTELDATKMYVIGGIVDKSRKKGATLNAASSAGIATARLPIQEHIADRLDHILNVNTVVEVLIRFRETGGDWPAALRYALPQRKQNQIGRKARRKQAARQETSESHERSNEDEVDRTADVEGSSGSEGRGGFPGGAERSRAQARSLDVLAASGVLRAMERLAPLEDLGSSAGSVADAEAPSCSS
ncbi:hypothetical protein PybrP1_001696 [[Pythium] brassicae (nom. inval.)]|nr:hypothetical protein PybrP1_001696 [[Pythium] brassicae (nom. inval.)]